MLHLKQLLTTILYNKALQETIKIVIRIIEIREYYLKKNNIYIIELIIILIILEIS